MPSETLQAPETRQASQPPETDPRDALALRLIAPRIAAYRAAVTTAHEHARAVLAAEGGTSRASLELGAFGTGRIDAARFATLHAGGAPLDAMARDRITKAADVLGALAAISDASFVVDVPAGVSLRLAVGSALARLGRAFGASIVVDLARAGRYVPAEHDRLLEWYAFTEWNRAERMAAPPLVVRLEGGDLRGGALAAFLDGAMHLAVVPRGPCAPAPLVGLLSPATLVLQTMDDMGTDRFRDFDGPAIAALVEAASACFLHDPAAGKGVWQRLRIWKRPAAPPRRTINGISPRQQLDAMAQLEALAERPSLSETPLEALAPGSGDLTDRLAAWLLDRSGVA